ncbi:MAG: D-tyrosyl-tRNA(Tyr) deacylase [Acidobacteria bacterium]|jgi:D-tyrosyl-tRNA(Tyr) deacylase|nr:D-tyrosyl-tRNA(Tyr) deacylase [Acidobacteriota bacterium]HJN45963.1 D-aminoacyl-tRNA deacylase [Vicinamibacterales bacterium]|tara:strand:- start:145 stop:594 length:450 start_codon:yes stop_codon:yes gene_type:complete
MRAVVQRVSSARVSVGDRLVATIEHGLLVYVGIARTDEASDSAYLANKIVGLRVFRDAEDRFNRTVHEVDGAVLLVSQFTLYGDCRRGRRSSFDRAAPPVEARVLYETLADALRGQDVPVQTGTFQAHMAVECVNDGPVTMLLDSGKAF